MIARPLLGKSFWEKSVLYQNTWAPRSHLVFPLPQVVQSDALHRTVATKLAAKHFLEHGDEVHMVLCVHCIVMVEVQKHHLHRSNITQLMVQNALYINLLFFYLFICILKNYIPGSSHLFPVSAKEGIDF